MHAYMRPKCADVKLHKREREREREFGEDRSACSYFSSRAKAILGSFDFHIEARMLAGRESVRFAKPRGFPIKTVIRPGRALDFR
jgi:hypothetical protein